MITDKPEIAVVIPSKEISNLIPCLQAINNNDPGHRLIVVDDGLGWVKPEDGVDVVYGNAPFVYAKNCNAGIRHALKHGADCVVLHNDDALLKTTEGFTRLAEIALNHADIGIIAPVTNVTGQPLQMPRKGPHAGLRKVPHIAFVSVLIPRRTFDAVGLLDERYCLDYGVEDRDYCETVNRAGLKVCVHDHVFVDHASLKSSFRGDPKTPRSFQQNYGLFKEKWGIRG